MNDLSVDLYQPARVRAPMWWRWKIDGRWSTWHLMATGLGGSGSWTLCNLLTVPDDVDEIGTHAGPPAKGYCRLCLKKGTADG